MALWNNLKVVMLLMTVLWAEVMLITDDVELKPAGNMSSEKKICGQSSLPMHSAEVMWLYGHRIFCLPMKRKDYKKHEKSLKFLQFS